MHGICFFHGWGYTSEFWNYLSNEINNDYIGCFDRGYFYKPNPLNLHELKPKTVCCHSMGLMFLDELIKQSDDFESVNLILLNSFVRFSTLEREAKNIDLMIDAFKESPIPVLRGFYRKSGLFHDCDVSQINKKLLLSDLLSLKEKVIDGEVFERFKYIILVRSNRDKIVSLSVHSELKKRIPIPFDEYVVEGDHSLSDNHDELIQLIKSVGISN